VTESTNRGSIKTRQTRFEIQITIQMGALGVEEAGKVGMDFPHVGISCL
jgi:hypothetical protein